MAGGEGSVFGKYFLLKRIASGGMGEIFLAKLKGPVGFEKLLVVKRILQHHLENQEFVDMFFAEARVAAQLTHSNIVQIYEMGEIEDCFYIAMEYVHGKPLREVLDRTRARGDSVQAAHAIEMISKVCEGMSYAHNATNMEGERIGIVHRDLNPHNLLVSYSGEVKIIDFGIAKTTMSTTKTESGTIKGKFVYMSPEQSAAEPLDKRSDLFSLGICLYETLTFTNPFAKANVVLSLDAIQRNDPPPVGQTNPKLAVFDPVISKALAKKRDDRYADCNDLRDALRELRKDGRVDDPTESLAEWMHDLFEEHIQIEKKMIRETDAVSTSQLRLMQQGHEREHQSGPHEARTPVTGRKKSDKSGEISAVVSPGTPQHSRVPFVSLLFTIALVSGVAATVVFKLVEKNRMALAASSMVQVPPPSAPGAPAGAVPVPGATTPLAVGSAATASGSGAADGSKPPDSPPEPAKPAAEEVKKKDSHKGRGGGSKGGGEEGLLGVLQISTVPPVKILHNGYGVGQNVKLRAGSGKLQFGSGKDPANDPFVVKVRYKIDGDTITYAIDAEPWAIVRSGGMGLGKTPLPPQSVSGTATFELVNPQEKLQLRITVRFSH
ncbi:MAG: serine/threonine protein kinase [Deltaproteobacteria bacterium]|nr:serine/threonine protein kinase [Deltaproteobacteria bacterium]